MAKHLDKELELFRAAVKDAKPIRPAHRVMPPAPRLPPVPVQGLVDERDALAELTHGPWPDDATIETEAEATYVRNGLPRDIVRKLRRGQWVIQDEIDLHGATRAIARVMLADFLRECARRGLRCVRIVHGKGLGSKNREPVLKGKVRNWLVQKDEVIAFTQARAQDGGHGALIVLLRPTTPAGAA